MAPKAKIDIPTMIEMVRQRKPNGKPYTQAEIAEQMGVTRVAIAKAMAKCSPSLLAKRDLNDYKRDRANILAELQQTLMRYVTPKKIESASLSQIITCMAILYDKERLERNNSTENVAINVKVENLDETVKAKMTDLIREMTRKRIEQAQEAEIETHY